MPSLGFSVPVPEPVPVPVPEIPSFLSARSSFLTLALAFGLHGRYNIPSFTTFPNLEDRVMGIQHASKSLRNAAKKRRKARKHKNRSTKKYKVKVS